MWSTNEGPDATREGGEGRRPIDRQKKGSSMHIGMHVWPLITRAAAACKSPHPFRTSLSPSVLPSCPPEPPPSTFHPLALRQVEPTLIPHRLVSYRPSQYTWLPRPTRGCQRILNASLLAVLNGSRTHLSASPFPHPLHLTSDPSRESSVFRSLPPPLLLLKPIRSSP